MLNVKDVKEMINHNQYKLKQEQKFKEQKNRIKKNFLMRFIKRVIFILIVAGSIGLFGWYLSKNSNKSDSSKPNSDDEIISTGFLHWHPQLEIYIKVEKQEIPAAIGLESSNHQPIHTHDSDGIIHLEIPGPVKREDTKLGKFFEIWSKQFNSGCIFNFCNGLDGSVKMFVNGQPNFDFENYYMRNGDKIEIRYE